MRYRIARIHNCQLRDLAFSILHDIVTPVPQITVLYILICGGALVANLPRWISNHATAHCNLCSIAPGQVAAAAILAFAWAMDSAHHFNFALTKGV